MSLIHVAMFVEMLMVVFCRTIIVCLIIHLHSQFLYNFLLAISDDNTNFNMCRTPSHIVHKLCCSMSLGSICSVSYLEICIQFLLPSIYQQ